MLVPRPDKCAIAALNCKIIQGGTRVNQDLMHGGGRPHRNEIGDAFNTLDLLSSPEYPGTLLRDDLIAFVKQRVRSAEPNFRIEPINHHQNGTQLLNQRDDMQTA